MLALSYIKIISRKYNDRFSVFTVPSINNDKEYSAVDMGFGRGCIKIAGFGDDDLSVVWYGEDGDKKIINLNDILDDKGLIKEDVYEIFEEQAETL